MRSVPFEFVSGLAAAFGVVECCWRENDVLSEPRRERSFTGFVTEVWFRSLLSEFAGAVGALVVWRLGAVAFRRFFMTLVTWQEKTGDRSVH
jgi:hypothetical protein